MTWMMRAARSCNDCDERRNLNKPVKGYTAPLAVLLGSLAYTMAVTQRTTMGVASLAATDRFDTNAEQLSVLAVAQLVMYAAMQVPVGLMLDRFGPRRLIFTGTLLISAGQYLVAFATQLFVAVAGRMIVGIGDAFLFISVIRLINIWYTGSRASKLQQWLANVGQFGQIISAFPFAMVLHSMGWNFAFSTWATIGLFVAIGVWALAADVTENHVNEHHVNVKARLKHLRADVKLPATKAAFWVHFAWNSPATVVLLLWGIPFLQQAQGLDRQVALGLLSSFVLVGLVFGTFLAWLCSNRPDLRRRTLELSAAFLFVAWVAVILWPGHAPLWLLIVWATATAGSGSTSMISFDYSRQYAPRRALGSINGYVNVGGFSASFSMMFIIGVALDLYYEFVGKNAELQLYSLQGFKLAFCIVPLVLIFGYWRYRVSERKMTAAANSSE